MSDPNNKVSLLGVCPVPLSDAFSLHNLNDFVFYLNKVSIFQSEEANFILRDTSDPLREACKKEASLIFLSHLVSQPQLPRTASDPLQVACRKGANSACLNKASRPQSKEANLIFLCHLRESTSLVLLGRRHSIQLLVNASDPLQQIYKREANLIYKASIFQREEANLILLGHVHESTIDEVYNANIFQQEELNLILGHIHESTIVEVYKVNRF